MRKARGTFWMRFFIVLLAVVFGALVYWSACFLLDDIRFIKYPSRTAFFKEHIDVSLQAQLKALQRRLKDLEHKHTLITQQRGFIKDSSGSLKITVDNLFRLKDRNQKLVSENQFDQLLVMLDKIIAIQADYKTTAELYLKTTNERYELGREIDALKSRIEEQRRKVEGMFAEVMRRHRMRTTTVKMAFLLILVLACTVLMMKKRKSIYRLIYIFAALAMYLKAAEVMHDHFPSRYFKYIITLALLALVGWGFGWLMRRLAKPKIATLLKQYRQAYERFLCPVCEYPIRTGPRKYLFWNRRSVHKTPLAGAIDVSQNVDELYTCPVCGTCLYEKCESCGKIRHSLLPNCQNCGKKQELTGETY